MATPRVVLALRPLDEQQLDHVVRGVTEDDRYGGAPRGAIIRCQHRRPRSQRVAEPPKRRMVDERVRVVRHG
jgi:hypothetical protein